MGPGPFAGPDTPRLGQWGGRGSDSRYGPGDGDGHIGRDVSVTPFPWASTVTNGSAKA